MKRLLTVLPLIALVALSGCGSGGATVTGKVSYKGRPITSGSVIVRNADGTAESGVILPDGTYTVAGVKPGHVQIGVFSPDPARARSILKPSEPRVKESPKGANAVHTSRKTTTPGWVPLPRSLGDPEKSGMACDVTSGDVRFDLDLK